jgi:hypothetical protein
VEIGFSGGWVLNTHLKSAEDAWKTRRTQHSLRRAYATERPVHSTSDPLHYHCSRMALFEEWR